MGDRCHFSPRRLRDTMGNCCEPRAPEGTENDATKVGVLTFRGSGFCGCSRPYMMRENDGCCAPSAPSGEKWDKIHTPDWEKILAEVDKESEAAPKGCCGTDLENVKKKLDEKWLAKANEYLAKHDFVADLYYFMTYNAGSKQPEQHLWLRIFELANAPKPAASDSAASAASSDKAAADAKAA